MAAPQFPPNAAIEEEDPVQVFHAALDNVKNILANLHLEQGGAGLLLGGPTKQLRLATLRLRHNCPDNVETSAQLFDSNFVAAVANHVQIGGSLKTAAVSVRETLRLLRSPRRRMMELLMDHSDDDDDDNNNNNIFGVEWKADLFRLPAILIAACRSTRRPKKRRRGLFEKDLANEVWKVVYVYVLCQLAVDEMHLNLNGGMEWNLQRLKYRIHELLGYQLFNTRVAETGIAFFLVDLFVSSSLSPTQQRTPPGLTLESVLQTLSGGGKSFASLTFVEEATGIPFYAVAACCTERLMKLHFVIDKVPEACQSILHNRQDHCRYLDKLREQQNLAIANGVSQSGKRTAPTDGEEADESLRFHRPGFPVLVELDVLIATGNTGEAILAAEKMENCKSFLDHDEIESAYDKLWEGLLYSDRLFHDREIPIEQSLALAFVPYAGDIAMSVFVHKFHEFAEDIAACTGLTFDDREYARTKCLQTLLRLLINRYTLPRIPPMYADFAKVPCDLKEEKQTQWAKDFLAREPTMAPSISMVDVYAKVYLPQLGQGLAIEARQQPEVKQYPASDAESSGVVAYEEANEYAAVAHAEQETGEVVETDENIEEVEEDHHAWLFAEKTGFVEPAQESLQQNGSGASEDEADIRSDEHSYDSSKGSGSSDHSSDDNLQKRPTNDEVVEIEDSSDEVASSAEGDECESGPDEYEPEPESPSRAFAQPGENPEAHEDPGYQRFESDESSQEILAPHQDQALSSDSPQSSEVSAHSGNDDASMKEVEEGTTLPSPLQETVRTAAEGGKQESPTTLDLAETVVESAIQTVAAGIAVRNVEGSIAGDSTKRFHFHSGKPDDNWQIASPAHHTNQQEIQENLSQVEAGYDAEDSQDAGTEEEYERRDSTEIRRSFSHAHASIEDNHVDLDGLPSGSHAIALDAPVPASEQTVDPGYEPEEEHTDADGIPRKRPPKPPTPPAPPIEAGYDAEDSQAATEEEEEVSEAIPTDDEKEQRKLAETLRAERKEKVGRIDSPKSGSHSLSDMSAADEASELDKCSRPEPDTPSYWNSSDAVIQGSSLIEIAARTQVNNDQLVRAQNEAPPQREAWSNLAATASAADAIASDGVSSVQRSQEEAPAMDDADDEAAGSEDEARTLIKRATPGSLSSTRKDDSSTVHTASPSRAPANTDADEAAAGSADEIATTKRSARGRKAAAKEDDRSAADTATSSRRSARSPPASDDGEEGEEAVCRADEARTTRTTRGRKAVTKKDDSNAADKATSSRRPTRSAPANDDSEEEEPAGRAVETPRTKRTTRGSKAAAKEDASSAADRATSARRPTRSAPANDDSEEEEDASGRAVQSPRTTRTTRGRKAVAKKDDSNAADKATSSWRPTRSAPANDDSEEEEPAGRAVETPRTKRTTRGSKAAAKEDASSAADTATSARRRTRSAPTNDDSEEEEDASDRAVQTPRTKRTTRGRKEAAKEDASSAADKPTSARRRTRSAPANDDAEEGEEAVGSADDTTRTTRTTRGRVAAKKKDDSSAADTATSSRRPARSKPEKNDDDNEETIAEIKATPTGRSTRATSGKQVDGDASAAVSRRSTRSRLAMEETSTGRTRAAKKGDRSSAPGQFSRVGSTAKRSASPRATGKRKKEAAVKSEDEHASQQPTRSSARRSYVKKSPRLGRRRKRSHDLFATSEDDDDDGAASVTALAGGQSNEGNRSSKKAKAGDSDAMQAIPQRSTRSNSAKGSDSNKGPGRKAKTATNDDAGSAYHVSSGRGTRSRGLKPPLPPHSDTTTRSKGKKK